ncbi:hypothetical protein BK022_07475 [Methylorubrum extorquens]|uniref:Uncharacterized protein n=1 Tax=Methylorubrum extorquens TaxID=408 RepID=A0A1S1P7D1_METEX|nr:hypothetical protein BK022_07475 [Methylorubrum extorquens]
MNAPATDTWPDTPRNRAAIAERWAKGHDTLRIARSIALTEPEVCRILARLQDERHAARIEASFNGVLS